MLRPAHTITNSVLIICSSSCAMQASYSFQTANANTSKSCILRTAQPAVRCEKTHKLPFTLCSGQLSLPRLWAKNKIQIASYSLALVVETASDHLGKQNCTKRQKFSSNRKASFKRALCFVPFTFAARSKISRLKTWYAIPAMAYPQPACPFLGGRSKNNDHVLQWRRSAESVDTIRVFSHVGVPPCQIKDDRSEHSRFCKLMYRHFLGSFLLTRPVHPLLQFH